MCEFPGTLTVRAAAIEGHPADAAVLVVGHPQPGGHAVPALDLHLHGSGACGRGNRSPAALGLRGYSIWAPGRGLPGRRAAPGRRGSARARAPAETAQGALAPSTAAQTRPTARGGLRATGRRTPKSRSLRAHPQGPPPCSGPQARGGKGGEPRPRPAPAYSGRLNRAQPGSPTVGSAGARAGRYEIGRDLSPAPRSSARRAPGPSAHAPPRLPPRPQPIDGRSEDAAPEGRARRRK